MKIAVIGFSGSGKSTLAKVLSKYYNVPLLYLDTVQFKTDWCVRDNAEGLEIVGKFLQNDSWVIDGNYQKYFQTERMEQADKIIFMNFNRFACFIRALKRYHTYKNKSRESITKGCNEKMDLEFVEWIFYKGRTKPIQDNFKSIVNKYKDKTIIIKNQRELSRFMIDNKLAESI